MSAETDEILDCFLELLRGPTGDGKSKRDAGTKVFWKVDQSHKDAMLRHLGRWWNGEKVDADSGSHPLVHLAWRALAVAYQETHEAAHEAKTDDREPCYTKLYGPPLDQPGGKTLDDYFNQFPQAIPTRKYRGK